MQTSITLKYFVRILGLAAISLWMNTSAAPLFDPRFQPIGYGSPFVLSKSGLAQGTAVVFRPTFTISRWAGDLSKSAVSSSGLISTTLDWTAAAQLTNRNLINDPRLIFTRRSDTGAAVDFTSITLSAAQQVQVPALTLNYLRGDRTGESTLYRPRDGILGDVIHSNPVYVDYGTAGLDTNDRVYVGANDGMLHAFNASTGAEIFAYVPSTLFPTLSLLSSLTYNNAHRYYVDGAIAVGDIMTSDATPISKKILVGGLGGGGQGLYALDVTTSAAADNTAVKRVLWEVNDSNAGFADLGFTYSMPTITKVHNGTGSKAAVIIGNGYASSFVDSSVGSGVAALMVLDANTGALIREISTGVGSSTDPNGLSTPRAVDTDADGIADYAYAGDLNGNLWRFDIRSGTASSWSVSFSAMPLFSAVNTAGDRQSITVQPAVVPHPNGGAIVLFGTGRLLDDEDVGDDSTQSLYGIRDRFDDTKVTANDLVTQELNEFAYTNPIDTTAAAQRVRASSNIVIDSADKGWLVDLNKGERVVTAVQVRSGRVIYTTTNTVLTPIQNWLVELNFLSGGSPDVIIFDTNKDFNRDSNDNVDANANGKRTDIIDRITGVYQNTGYISSPTLAVLSAEEGTFLINEQNPAATTVTPSSPPPTDPGVAGGHFDVDTTSYISPSPGGSTDGHVHQYDDKFDVLGIDYFHFLDPVLHPINADITDRNQRFKLLLANTDLSTGGRFSVNQTYNATTASTYTTAPTYAAMSTATLPVFALNSGVLGATQLTSLSMYFDRNAIIDGGLIGTVTGCVRSNQRGFGGEWRNGALTVWAVKVNADGTDNFVVTKNASSGKITGITSGLLWESTVFWHWKGPCYLTDQSVKSTQDPTKTVRQYYYDLTLSLASPPTTTATTADNKRKKDPKKTNTTTTASPAPPSAAASSFNRLVESISNPGQVSWKELFE